MKLPVLIEHFIEHKEKDTKLSVFKFLTNHYAQEDDHDGDEEREMDLPFKSHDGCLNSVVIAFMPNNIDGLIIKPSFIETKTCFIYSEQFL
ncbi:MAG: hypothetical protein WCH21_08430, partial [Bacteroidota bacterium]